MESAKLLFASISNFDYSSLYYGIEAIYEHISVKDVFDIILTSALIFLFLFLFKKTKIVSTALSIGVILFLLYLISYWFGFYTILTLIKVFLGSVIVVAAVVFQKEIRRFFELTNLSNIRKSIERRSASGETVYAGISEIITHTISVMAERKIGALIVIPQLESIDPIVTGGFALEGKLSEPLLLSIFDTSSPGHDGAVILENNIIKKFGVFLPLSEKDNLEELKRVGTRHRAALGLSERSDAICIAVSEEKGTISVAREGKLKKITNENELMSVLDNAFGFKTDDLGYNKKIFERVSILRFMTKYLKSIVWSLLFGFGLWLMISYANSSIIQKTFEVPIAFKNTPPLTIVESIKPFQVSIIFLGSENDFKLIKDEDIKAVIDVSELNISESKATYHTIKLSKSNIKYPSGISLRKIDPSSISFRLSPQTQPISSGQ